MKILQHATIRMNFHAPLLEGKKKGNRRESREHIPQPWEVWPEQTSVSRGGILRRNARLVWKRERCSANEDQLEDWI